MRLLRLTHLWAGVVLVLVFLVIGLSGTVAALRAEIVRATVPAARAPAPDPSTWGAALQRLEAQAPGQLRMIRLSPYGLGVHSVKLAGDKGVFIDGEGRVVSRWTTNSRFEDWALTLHQTLLAGPLGEKIVGYLGLAGLGMALSGLIVWAPAWRSFRLRLWPRSAAPRDLVATHRDLGIVLALLILVQFFTGAGMVFAGAIQARLGGVEVKTWPSERIESRPADWPAILVGLRAVDPQARIRTIYAPGKPGDAYMAYLQPHGDVDAKGRVTVFLDAGGRVLDVAKPPPLSVGARITRTFFGVHSGDFGGAATRYVAALGGVGVSVLGLLGAWSFFARRLRPRRRP